jgi:hypothetical protein
MQHLKAEELRQRAGDLMVNVIELTPEGKIGAVPFDAEGTELWRKWCHACEEFQLRFGPYPAGWDTGWVKGIKGLKLDHPTVPPPSTLPWRPVETCCSSSVSEFTWRRCSSRARSGSLRPQVTVIHR